MDSFLSQMTARQAREWELFALEEPAFEDKIMLQLAMIAQLFASCFIKKKDKTTWGLSEFIPDFSKKEKKPVSNFKAKVFGVLKDFGDSKIKKKAEDLSNNQMVKGTDGKFYKYKMEEFVKERTTPPKRLRGKK